MSAFAMERETILTKISESQQLLKNYGVKNLRLFGSVARGTERAGSDVDLLVEFESSARIGMFEFSRLRRELSQLLECDVDLATPDALHKQMKEHILKEAISAA
jgi:predicted nucleotidyltransferase